MAKKQNKVETLPNGLSVVQKREIDSHFMAKTVEMETLSKIYGDVVSSEITPELTGKAKELRLKLVKYRTSIADIHKVQKAYFLAGGRYVDSWKNKETETCEQMEDRCLEVEKYYENIERKRLEELYKERSEKLRPYITENYPEPAGLSLMTPEHFEITLRQAKTLHKVYLREQQEAELFEERLAILGQFTNVKCSERDEVITYSGVDDDAEVSYSELMEMSEASFDRLTSDISKLEDKRASAILHAAKEMAVEAEIKEDCDDDVDSLLRWVDKAFVCKVRLDHLTGEAALVEQDIFSKFEAFKKWARKQIESNGKI